MPRLCVSCGYDLNDGEHPNNVIDCHSCSSDRYVYSPANDYAAERDWQDTTFPNEY